MPSTLDQGAAANIIAVRDALLTIVSVACPEGKFYGRRRFTADFRGFLGLFQTQVAGQKVVHGGWVAFTGVPSSDDVDVGFGHVRDWCAYELVVIRGFNDADSSLDDFTELVANLDYLLASTLQDGIPDVQRAARAPLTYGLDLRSYGGVLCDYAEFTLLVPVVNRVGFHA
jgi:hypothetical protein